MQCTGAKQKANLHGQKMEKVEFCIIFMQEPRFWIDAQTVTETKVAFKVVANEIDYYQRSDPICYEKGRAMSRSQSKKFDEKFRDFERIEFAK